jgi:phage shock protein A
MFGRLINVIKGMFARFVSNVESANPEALLELEQENLREQIVRFNQGLVSHAALAERLVRQVGNLEKEREELHARTKGLLQAGKQDVAAKSALALQKLVGELDENRQQAEEAEHTYKDLVRARDAAIETARDKIGRLRRSIDEMRIQQAMSELNQMASGLMTSIGGAGESLARLESMVEEQRSLAAGTSRVVREDLSANELMAKEEENDALANQALANFAAREGISLTTGEASKSSGQSTFDEITKVMGPGNSEGES